MTMRKIIVAIIAVTVVLGSSTFALARGNQARQAMETMTKGASTAASASNISPKVFRHAEELYKKETGRVINSQETEWLATTEGFELDYAIMITWDGKIFLLSRDWKSKSSKKIIGTWGDE